jgi:hypothetical protein
MITAYITMLFMLMVGHALADFPLQGDFLSNAKNRRTHLGKVYWKHALPAHGLIHGGFVAIFTGVVWFGIAEAIFHAIIDYMKGEELIDHNTDQLMHIICKIGWAFGAVLLGSKGII